MKPRKPILTLAGVLVISAAFSQTYSDCNNALEICAKGSLRFEFNRDTTDAHDHELGSCLSIDYPTTWVKWEIVEDGIFTFTISPETYEEDIDFAVFKLTDGDNCDHKTLMRCMTSGMNVEAPHSSVRCLGPTGLSIKEPKREVRGKQGCKPGTNNFLAKLVCKKGDRYALAIQNFDNSAGGFFIDFCGDAKLPCDQTSCMEFTGDGKYRDLKEFAIIPISTSLDSLPISLFLSEIAPVDIELVDEDKKVVAHHTFLPTDMKTTCKIGMSDLPNRKYGIQLKVKKRIAKGAFVMASGIGKPDRDF